MIFDGAHACMLKVTCVLKILCIQEIFLGESYTYSFSHFFVMQYDGLTTGNCLLVEIKYEIIYMNGTFYIFLDNCENFFQATK